MRTGHDELWGTGRGLAVRLAPPTRLGVAAMLFVTCLVAPADTRLGSLLIAAVTVGWLLVCRPPARVVRTALLFGLALFLPYLLLAPLGDASALDVAQAWLERLSAPSAVVLRGLGTLLLGTATVASLAQRELREALERLPLPRLVGAIVIQMVHQSGTLLRETRQIAAALAVRGATGARLVGLRTLTALPQIWLPRIAFRAERVAAAMELRGYADAEALPAGGRALRGADFVAIAVALGLLSVAIRLRLGGRP